MRKPDFYIVGAPKAGTTSLHHYLRQHPQIFLPSCKEPQFFIDGDYYGGVPVFTPNRVLTVEAYLALFAGVPEHVKAGEASPNYLYCRTSPMRIREFTPDARIVAILRNPVARAYSHYYQHRRGGRESLSFEEALATETERPATFHYVQHGLYTHQLRRYLAEFGETNVGVFFMDDLACDPAELCRRVFSFLEVDPDVQVDASTVHNAAAAPRSLAVIRQYRSVFSGRRAYIRMAKRLVPSRIRLAARSGAARLLLTRRVPPIREDTRLELIDRYRADVAELEKLTGRDLGHWLA